MAASALRHPPSSILRSPFPAPTHPSPLGQSRLGGRGSRRADFPAKNAAEPRPPGMVKRDCPALTPNIPRISLLHFTDEYGIRKLDGCLPHPSRIPAASARDRFGTGGKNGRAHVRPLSPVHHRARSAPQPVPIANCQCVSASLRVQSGSTWDPDGIQMGSSMDPLWIHFGSTSAPVWIHFGSTLATVAADLERRKSLYIKD